MYKLCRRIIRKHMKSAHLPCVLRMRMRMRMNCICVEASGFCVDRTQKTIQHTEEGKRRQINRKINGIQGRMCKEIAKQKPAPVKCIPAECCLLKMMHFLPGYHHFSITMYNFGRFWLISGCRRPLFYGYIK